MNGEQRRSHWSDVSVDWKYRAQEAEAELADLIEDMESLSDINNELNSDIAALVEALGEIEGKAKHVTDHHPEGFKQNLASVVVIAREALKNHGARGQQIMAERENLRATMQKVLDALDHEGAVSGWGVVRDWMRETLAGIGK